MPKLSKAEFARLVSEMPDASEQEILAEATRREQGGAAPVDNRSVFGKTADAVIPTALRVGGAIGGGILGGVVGNLPGVVAGGAGGSGLGEIAAEGYEDWRGLRGTDEAGEGLFDDINPNQVAVQAALGAVPVVGKAGSLGKTMLNRGMQGAVLGGAGAVATPLAEGELPTLGGVALGAGLGGVLGAGGGALEARSLRRAAAPQVEAPPPAATPHMPSGPAGVAAPDVPSVQMMPGNVPPEFHSVMDGFSNPQKFMDPQGSPLVDGSDYGIVSWANPGTELPPAENAALMQQLEAELRRRGFNPIAQRGVFGAEEPSFLVPGMTPEMVKEVGRMGKAPQVSVISREGYHRLADDATFPARGVAFDQNVDNYYSEIQLPGHGPVKYQMDYPEEAFGPPATSGVPEAPVQLPPASTAAIAETEAPSFPKASTGTAGNKALAAEKQRVDAFRAEAAAKRAGQGATTAMAIAAPAAALGVPDDPDSQWDDVARLVLSAGGAAALGHAGLSAKMAKDLQKVFKQAPTESKGFTLVRNHLKKVFADKPQKAYELLQRFMAKDVPAGTLENIDLSKRKPLLNGVVRAQKVVDKATGKARTEVSLTPETTQRLDALFEHSKTLGADWTKDGAELAKLIPDAEERRMFTRAFAALSPTTPLELNFLQTAIAYPMLRAGSSPQDVLQALQKEAGHGMGNPGAKLPNLKRAAQGEDLKGEKVQALDKGVFGKGSDEVPLDIHFLRALGAIEEKPPSKLLYQAINRAIAKYAKEQHGLGAFDYMAPIWGAMRQLTRGDAGSGVAQLMKKVGLDQPSIFTGNPLARFKPEDFPGVPLGPQHPAAQPAIDPQVLRALMHGKEAKVKAPTPLKDAKKAGQQELNFKAKPESRERNLPF
jgi:hypothetical protein